MNPYIRYEQQSLLLGNLQLHPMERPNTKNRSVGAKYGCIDQHKHTETAVTYHEPDKT